MADCHGERGMEVEKKWVAILDENDDQQRDFGCHIFFRESKRAEGITWCVENPRGCIPTQLLQWLNSDGLKCR